MCNRSCTGCCISTETRARPQVTFRMNGRVGRVPILTGQRGDQHGPGLEVSQRPDASPHAHAYHPIWAGSYLLGTLVSTYRPTPVLYLSRYPCVPCLLNASIKDSEVLSSFLLAATEVISPVCPSACPSNVQIARAGLVYHQLTRCVRSYVQVSRSPALGSLGCLVHRVWSR